MVFPFSGCSDVPVHLDGPPRQSRACVVTFQQKITDPTISDSLGGVTEVQRRYLVYVPTPLPAVPMPLVFAFPGRSESAESVALYDTRLRFETLADRDGFMVVYGNGLPDGLDASEMQFVNGGFFQGCMAPHDGEGIDVSYVRQILDQLGRELPLDRSRIYATGISAGGGMSFELALEAPDVVAAIAPVVPLPFQPSGAWAMRCQPRPGYDQISIAMVAATADPWISYLPGSSRVFPQAQYPGMEETRDAWLSAMGLVAPAQIDELPDVVQGDSYQPDSGLTTSTIERQSYPSASDGRELVFYKAIGMGHTWPNPVQTPSSLWPMFGKTNQDIDFADVAWSFFQRHAKH